MKISEILIPTTASLLAPIKASRAKISIIAMGSLCLLAYFYPQKTHAILDRIRKFYSKPIFCFRGLAISCVRESEYAMIASILEDWLTISKAKYLECHQKNYRDHAEQYKKTVENTLINTGPHNSSLCTYFYNEEGKLLPRIETRDARTCDVGIRFSELSRILGLMIDQLTPSEYIDPDDARWDLILVSKTAQKIEAIGFFNRQSSELIYLATHPENVGHAINTKRIQGAGSSIILYLAKQMLTSKTDLILESIDNAMPFYEKLHFEKRDIEWEGNYLVLTAQKIQSLLERKIPPFDSLYTQTS